MCQGGSATIVRYRLLIRQHVQCWGLFREDQLASLGQNGAGFVPPRILVIWLLREAGAEQAIEEACHRFDVGIMVMARTTHKASARRVTHRATDPHS